MLRILWLFLLSLLTQLGSAAETTKLLESLMHINTDYNPKSKTALKSWVTHGSLPGFLGSAGRPRKQEGQAPLLYSFYCTAKDQERTVGPWRCSFMHAFSNLWRWVQIQEEKQCYQLPSKCAEMAQNGLGTNIHTKSARRQEGDLSINEGGGNGVSFF